MYFNIINKLIFTFLTFSFYSFTYSQSSSIPDLIPKKNSGKLFGYVNKESKIIINPEYDYALFFSEDCRLLGSSNPDLKIYGTADYATVEKDLISYRIDKKGKRVYQYQQSDLGFCNKPFIPNKYKPFRMYGNYGLVSKIEGDFSTPEDFEIYPEYQMLHVLFGDRENPMIIAVKNDLFGVINRKNEIIIPFQYSDIKPNLSWEIANLFEVSKDGINYFYIDVNNKAY